ncbi:WAT1-related protein [Glycine max]|nr:WAT1-related protein [Glycine max]
MGELKPYLAVFIIQLIYSGLTLLSKAAFNGGMNTCVFISYRQLTGTVIMVPLALILERKRAVPVSLSFFTFCKIFVFFISWVQLTLALNMQAIALVYTSATLAAAIVNSLPASTFFFAVQNGEGKYKDKIWNYKDWKCIIRPLASYKGPQLRTEHHILSRYHHHHSPRHEDHFSSWQKMDIGFFSLVLKRHPVEFLAYNSEQPQILESYPAKLKFSSLQCLSSSIQSFGIDIAFERDIQQWKLGWNMRLLEVVYCGALVTGVSYYLQAWVIEKRGPFSQVMWNPLSFILATTGSILFLGEPLFWEETSHHHHTYLAHTQGQRRPKMKGNNPYLIVVLVQAIYAAMFLLSKAAFDHGMNNFIFVFYRQAVATIFLTPFTFFFEWITLSLDIYGIGLIYTSATLAAATTNCLPAITFFLAFLLRIESLKIKTTPGIAKLIGVVACLAGAATFAFYKGPSLKFLSHFHLLDYHKSIQHQGHAQSGAWIKGCFLMLLSNTFFGLWLVLQTFIIKGYPSKLLFTTIQCFLSSIQSFVIALAVERDIEQWKLGWNVRLLAVLYCSSRRVRIDSRTVQRIVGKEQGAHAKSHIRHGASIIGITLTLEIYGIALIYTSVTLAAATSNSLPAITFFLALLLRIESLKIKTTPGIVKLIGIVACLAGAATLAFYKGPPLKFLSHYHLLDYHKTLQHQGRAPSGAWIKGCFLMILSNTCFGLWFVLQAFIIKVYPSKLLFTTIQCFLSSIQSLVIALAVERDIEQWKLGWNARLLAGIMVTGVTYYLQTWVIEKKGPVFLAMSTPLSSRRIHIDSRIVQRIVGKEQRASHAKSLTRRGANIE